MNKELSFKVGNSAHKIVVEDLVTMAVNVKEQNRAFAKLPKNKQRIEVAKDALAQLLLGMYKATPGTYASWQPNDHLVSSEAWDQESPTRKLQLQDLLLTKVGPRGNKQLENCNVCGIGAVLLSTIRIKDKLTIGDCLDTQDGDTSFPYEGGLNLSFSGATGTGGFNDMVTNVFTPDQLSDMESDFENNGCDRGNRITLIKNDNDRLMMILLRVIECDGNYTRPTTLMDDTRFERDGRTVRGAETVWRDEVHAFHLAATKAVNATWKKLFYKPKKKAGGR